MDFRRLAAAATAADLRRRSDGTTWTNQEPLFHMLLGYLAVRALLVLVRVFGLLPGPASKACARLPGSACGPFDLALHAGMHFPATWDPFFSPPPAEAAT